MADRRESNSKELVEMVHRFVFYKLMWWNHEDEYPINVPLERIEQAATEIVAEVVRLVDKRAHEVIDAASREL